MSPARRIWPATPAEKEDRRHVVELIRRTGEEKLQFTVYDVRRTMKAHPHLQLNHSGQLSRHMHDIEGEILIAVGQRLAGGRPRDEGQPSRARHQFVLAHRVLEWQGAKPVLDDLERVHYALWVAIEALGVDRVTTRAVTRVLRHIEALHLLEDRQTRVLLTTLEQRNHQLAVESKAKGGRWSQWQPLGAKPDHGDFDSWVRTMRTLYEGSPQPARFQHGTLNEMLIELVGIAIQQSRSSTYPAGKPVTITDLRAVCGADPRAREIHEALVDRGLSLGAGLGDLTKARIAGQHRVHQRVVKVASPVGEGAYYDLPDLDGAEARAVVMRYWIAKQALKEKWLTALEEEAQHAEALLERQHSTAVHILARSRQARVHGEFDALRSELDEVMQEEHLLSKHVRDSLSHLRSRLVAAVDRLPAREAIYDQLTEDLKSVPGITLADCEGAEGHQRPLLTPSEYVGYLGAHVLAGLTPPEFLANAISLTRYPNPAFTVQTDPDPIKAARYGVDRVEGLMYMAERYRGQVRFLLGEGARLLGSTVRDPKLVPMVLRHGFARERPAALAGLVLLGAHDAENEALAVLRASGRPNDVVDALHALLVLKKVDPAKIPRQVHESTDPRIKKALREVVIASRTGRWLLQG